MNCTVSHLHDCISSMFRVDFRDSFRNNSFFGLQVDTNWLCLRYKSHSHASAAVAPVRPHAVHGQLRSLEATAKIRTDGLVTYLKRDRRTSAA